jgi:hypothetical protein
MSIKGLDFTVHIDTIKASIKYNSFDSENGEKHV